MNVTYKVRIPIGDKLAYTVGEADNLADATKMAEAEEGAASIVKVTQEVVFRKPGPELTKIEGQARLLGDAAKRVFR